MNNNPALKATAPILECRMCPSMIFFSQKEFEDHNRTTHGKLQQQAVKKVIAPPVPPKPISLTYKYDGQCSCGSNVETLILDIEGSKKSHVCVAWCPGCKKQLQHKAVPKL